MARRYVPFRHAIRPASRPTLLMPASRRVFGPCRSYMSKWFGSVVGRQDARSMAKPKQSLHRQNWRMPGGSGCRFLKIRASLVPQLLVVGFNKSRASSTAHAGSVVVCVAWFV